MASPATGRQTTSGRHQTVTQSTKKRPTRRTHDLNTDTHAAHQAMTTQQASISRRTGVFSLVLVLAVSAATLTNLPQFNCQTNEPACRRSQNHNHNQLQLQDLNPNLNDNLSLHQQAATPIKTTQSNSPAEQTFDSSSASSVDQREALQTGSKKGLAEVSSATSRQQRQFAGTLSRPSALKDRLILGPVADSSPQAEEFNLATNPRQTNNDSPAALSSPAADSSSSVPNSQDSQEQQQASNNSNPSLTAGEFDKPSLQTPSMPTTTSSSLASESAGSRATIPASTNLGPLASTLDPNINANSNQNSPSDNIYTKAINNSGNQFERRMGSNSDDVSSSQNNNNIEQLGVLRASDSTGSGQADTPSGLELNSIEQSPAHQHHIPHLQQHAHQHRSLLFQTSNGQPTSGSMQAMSSAPSSVSIITPIVVPRSGPVQAHISPSIGSGATGSPDTQAQQMGPKPLFVLGAPLSERDYNHVPTSASAGASTSLGIGLESEAAQPVTTTSVIATTTLASAPINSSSSSYASTSGSSSGSSSASSAQVSLGSRRSPKLGDSGDSKLELPEQAAAANTSSSYAPDRVGGPSLVYSDGHLSAESQAGAAQQQPATLPAATPIAAGNPSLTPRVFQNQQRQQELLTSATTSSLGAASVQGNSQRRPSLPPPVNQANAASGFRSPLSSSGPLVGSLPSSGSSTSGNSQQQAPPFSGQPLVALVASNQQQQQPLAAPATLPAQMMTQSYHQTTPPYVGPTSLMPSSNNVQSQLYNSAANYNRPGFMLGGHAANVASNHQQQQQTIAQSQLTTSHTNGLLVPPSSSGSGSGSGYSGRRPLNITRVEHISAECSNDLIRAVIVFNGTFKGIIYSSGYVNDPTCLYVNGTGSARYEFSIRLNQCGTLGAQQVHQPSSPGEARRRDQVMWNTLSIQYNSIIEQEWDEHFKVSCEYGSDFWKTVSFSPFNVETNTGSPVVFTINPPQCQMDVLLGHGVGPKIATVDGPVTVGDALTLLIHMKSEKAGYDILVKNCVAHNGGKQRMQLIDSNGCVVNERFISPFRGTYNDNDLKHVTLYAYLKAFRFTGSPVLYLECEIHMCQSACPPQMCYWRRLSKRSADNFELEYTKNTSRYDDDSNLPEQPVVSDSLNLFKALQVRTEAPEKSARSRQKKMSEIYSMDEDLAKDSARFGDDPSLVCYRYVEVMMFMITIATILLLVVSVAFTCWLRIRKLSKLRNPGPTHQGQCHQQQHHHHDSWGRSSLDSTGSLTSPSSVSSICTSSHSNLIVPKKPNKVAIWPPKHNNINHNHNQTSHIKQMFVNQRGHDSISILSPRPTMDC